MSFKDIFKKGFLTSYANTEITFRYAHLFPTRQGDMASKATPHKSGRKLHTKMLN